MTRWLIAPLLVLAVSSALVVQAAPPTTQQMAARIDGLLAKRWRQEKIQPAPRSSDAEFLRRASLDLTGVIPAVSEVREFLKDQKPNKRARLIERLLTKPTHATHFANLWRSVMLPTESNATRFGQDRGFQTWLRGHFADNTPYNEIATELLVASGNTRTTGPALFYGALQLKPEELAASTSRIFLGVQIQCAQCHDHPFDHWTREDFWGYAAFFARLQRPARQQAFVTQVVEGDSGEVKIPETDKIIPPKFLGGEESADSDQKRRIRLAAWLTADDNPYFAKAAVNRIWATLFGRGIVDPIDDLGGHNPPSHPKLLDELADYFVATKFNVRRLLTTLTSTQAYQLSSESTDQSDDRPELFARMAIKSLTAEQLYDCLIEAMRKRENVSVAGRQTFGFRGVDQNRQAFLAKFRAPTQGATEYEAGIPQALTLMNGQMVRDATDLANSDLLIALEAPFFSDEQRVETLFLSTLSRLPNDKERTMFEKHAREAAAAGERRKGLGDILWALLNSAEFVLNH